MKFNPVLMCLVIMSISYSKQVISQCTVMPEPISFGQYDALSSPSLETASYIDLLCSQGLLYKLAIDAGRNAGGNIVSRHMVSTGTTTPLFYNIFFDPSHTQIWGDGVGASQAFNGIGNGNRLKIPVYAQIPGHQRIMAGEYSDSLIITLEW